MRYSIAENFFAFVYTCGLFRSGESAISTTTFSINQQLAAHGPSGSQLSPLSRN